MVKNATTENWALFENIALHYIWQTVTTRL